MKLYPDDWRSRVANGVVVAACMAAVIFLGPSVGINGFWPGVLAITTAIIAGQVLVALVGRRMFRRPADGPPDHPPA